MCGRFVLTHPNDALARLFDAQPVNDLPQGARYNICPTQSVAVVVPSNHGRVLTHKRWGFVPHWYKHPNDGPLLINARGETIAQKPAFAQACRQTRCLIPASGFYEWTKDASDNRLPWFISRQDAAVMVFAGIWQDWGQGEDRISTCAIVTTHANSATKQIHHRLPVILEPAEWALWLGEQGKGASRLMQPCAHDVLQFHRVDPSVNSNKATGQQLIEKIA